LLRPFLAAVALVASAGENCSADLVSITTSRDNSIFLESNNSAGGSTFFYSGRNNMGAPRRALLEFDIASSGIPSGSTIDSVKLTLHMNGAAMTETLARNMSLHQLLGDWGEGTNSGGMGMGGQGTPANAGAATWNHQFFNTDLWTTPGGDFDSTASATTSVGVAVANYTWNSTPLLVADVQGWLDNPASNFGWILIGVESTNATSRRFESREAAALLRPLLEIEYTAAPTSTPEPSTFALSFLAAASLVFNRRCLRRKGTARA
jgi:hypothetical protein